MSTNTSREYLMACLARQVIADSPNADAMRRWFDRWGARHGPEARAELRAAVVAERERQKAAADDGPMSEHEQHKADLIANRKIYAVLAADDISAALDETRPTR